MTNEEYWAEASEQTLIRAVVHYLSDGYGHCSLRVVDSEDGLGTYVWEGSDSCESSFDLEPALPIELWERLKVVARGA